MACQTGLQGGCTKLMKNVIYRVVCTLCTKSYVRETKRHIRERILAHRRAALSRDMQSPWGAHYSTELNGEQVPEIQFSAKINCRARDHDIVERKLGEAVEIAETAPQLNTDSRWLQLLPTIRKRLSK